MSAAGGDLSNSNSPAGQVSSAVSLQSDGRFADLSVSNSLQPTSARLLDLDAGRAELIGPELLQVRHLTRSEEDLGLTELEHIGVLRFTRQTNAEIYLSISVSGNDQMDDADYYITV